MISVKRDFRAPEDIWYSILERIHEYMGPAVFKTWFANLSFKELRNDTIVITAPSRFIREWILTNYYNKLKEFTALEAPSVKRIDLRVKAAERVRYEGGADDKEEIIPSQPINLNLNTLDDRFTFENFVIGESNKLAYSAAYTVAKEGVSNPLIKGVLYISGAVGMGKTHLLQAIAHHISTNLLSQKAMYLSAEKFMHQYIKAVKTNETHQFKELMRDADVLLFDDLQFICGKSGTQQEFANTLNAMIESGKIVVVSSDRSPYALELDQRTTSRLAGGLVVEIKQPDLKLKMDILSHKASKANIAVDDNLKKVLEFIAGNVNSSVRELEAAFNKLLASASLMGHEIDLDLAKESLKDCIKSNQQAISVEKIIEVVANYYGVTKSEITSKGRAPKFVYPRQVAAFLAKQLTDKSLQEIGHKLGKRDHATIIYSIKKLEDKMLENQKISIEVKKLIDIIASNN